MNLDFPIQQIKFDFKLAGTGSVKIKLNDKFIEGNLIAGKDLEVKNNVTIYFTKNDASDSSSFAILTNFLINGGNFNDDIKSIDYQVDKTKHPDSPSELKNNLYFGYICS